MEQPDATYNPVIYKRIRVIRLPSTFTRRNFYSYFVYVGISTRRTENCAYVNFVVFRKIRDEFFGICTSIVGGEI